jgi:hypothetical protein
MPVSNAPWLLDSNSTLRQNPRKSMLGKPGLFNAPSAPAASLPQRDYIQPNLGHALRIWWAYYWPTFLISSFIIGVLMVLLRKAWENVMVSGDVVRWANRILPYLVFYAVSVLTIRYILGKKFRSFCIALLPRDASSGVQPLPRSFRRTLRVWWAFCWRAVVYSVIARVAAAVVLGFTIAILAAMGRVMALLVPIVSQVAIEGAIGLFVIYSAILDEEFEDFRVTLVPPGAVLGTASAVEPAAPNPLPQ